MKVRGYTLIELLVVLALMGILAMAVMPMAELTVQRQREHALREALWTIRKALDDFKQAADDGRVKVGAGPNGYPVSLEVLVDGAKGADGRALRFLRQLPRDPFAAEGTSAVEGWALRSYSSPPQAPSSGQDVFDIHSRSERMGSDGVPLAKW